VIDVYAEDMLTLAQVPDLLPRRARGRKLHLSTVYRWATSGCRGVVLETIQVGATRCTNREALQRFFEALTASRGAKGPSGTSDAARRPVLRSAARRQRDSERAARQLEAMGV
jgi:hypothetical protein